MIVNRVSHIIPEDYIDSAQKGTMQHWIVMVGETYLQWQKYISVEMKKVYNTVKINVTNI